jgi:hypothetical protein
MVPPYHCPQQVRPPADRVIVRRCWPSHGRNPRYKSRRPLSLLRVDAPFLHGEAKTASSGSVSRVPAADIEDIVVKFLKEHLAARQDKSTTSAVRIEDRGALAELIAGIIVHKDRLIVRLKAENSDEASDPAG